MSPVFGVWRTPENEGHLRGWRFRRSITAASLVRGRRGPEKKAPTRFASHLGNFTPRALRVHNYRLGAALMREFVRALGRVRAEAAERPDLARPARCSATSTSIPGRRPRCRGRLLTALCVASPRVGWKSLGRRRRTCSLERRPSGSSTGCGPRAAVDVDGGAPHRGDSASGRVVRPGRHFAPCRGRLVLAGSPALATIDAPHPGAHRGASADGAGAFAGSAGGPARRRLRRQAGGTLEAAYDKALLRDAPRAMRDRILAAPVSATEAEDAEEMRLVTAARAVSTAKVGTLGRVRGHWPACDAMVAEEDGAFALSDATDFGQGGRAGTPQEGWAGS